MDNEEAGESKPVGYGNPPEEHQFPNNPKRQRGRKLGSKNKPKLPPDLTESEAIALQESKRMVKTSDGPMEATRAINRAQIKTAAQGGTNAQKAHLARTDALERKKKAAEDAKLTFWEDFVQLGEEVLELSPPDEREYLHRTLLPHPHDVEVDFEKRRVRILGPSTSLERRQWNRMKGLLADLRSKIEGLGEELEKNPKDRTKQRAYYLYGEHHERICNSLPERHRPEPIPNWLLTKAMNLMFTRAIRENRRDTKRLIANPELLPEYIERLGG